MAGQSKWRMNYVVDEVTGCHLWKGELKDGYGRVTLSDLRRKGRRKRLRKMAHKAFWEEKNGPVPTGFELHHDCRVRRCVNDAHLILLTPEAHTELHRKPIKLTTEAVIQMREDRTRGMSYEALGLKYGVCADYAGDVVKRLGWRSVA